MIIENISDSIFKSNDNDIVTLLKENFQNEMVNKLYFNPKNVNKDSINDKLSDNNYLTKVLNTIEFFKNKNIVELIQKKFSGFDLNMNMKVENVKMFLIIGLDTTTIYSTTLDGEDVTVLLLEATNGEEKVLDMLLAHEYTHFVRKQILNKDIFESSIGERFVTEGIASNYSREVIPGKEDYEYCIVNKETVNWVKNNMKNIEEHMENKKDTNELMSDYFYMFADTNKTGMPVRTGYVYGYLKVKEYLEKNNISVKDVIGIDWKKII